MALSSSHIVVQVTVRTAEDASLIARTLVERRLAASAQVAPIRTHYRWRGGVHEHDEHLVTLFSQARAYDALAACVRDLHDYEIPQIVALPILTGWPAFLAWMDESTTAPEAALTARGNEKKEEPQG